MFNQFSIFKKYSKKEAIIAGDKRWTYQDLDEISDFYAHQILHAFASRYENLPKVVPIIGHRSAEYIASVLACWKLGIGIVPIAHDTPTERIKLIISEINVKSAIRLGAYEIPEGIEVISLKSTNSDCNDLFDAFPAAVDDIAYILYTSGSTGKPKGCVVGAESLEPIIASFAKYYGIDNSSRVTFVANIAFDAAMTEWLPALVTGASVYIVEKDVLLNKERLIDFYHKHEITFSWLPTPLAEGLMNDEKVNLPTSLGVLLTAGQRLTARPPSSWHTRVENAYGPTECTVIVSSSVVEPGKKGLPDIGKPLPGIECFIVDENRNILALGESGELAVSGIGVSRGYFGKESLTEAAFFELDIEDDKKVLVYATGDICRFNSLGNLEFIERKDKQVKLNGFRIELGEILENLLALDEVEQAYILCKKIGSQNVLLAYIVASGVDKLDENAIKDKLQKTLPDYMIPSSIQTLPKLPLTSNQKVDETKLPLPAASTSYRYELTTEQQEFLAIFNRHMGITIGWEDDFFRMGGNSVTLISIAAEVYRAMSITLSFSITQEYRTPAKIWSAIENADAKQVVISKHMDKQSEFVDIQLSSSQKSVWFLASTDPSDKAYHAKSRLSLFGQVNSNAVQYGLQKVVDRNGIFRTAFIPGDGDGLQRVFRHYEVELIQIDLSILNQTDRAKELERLLQEDLNEPFDLQKLPLVRWALIKMDERESVLAHIEHHLVHDGWSYNLFLKEFDFYYKQYVEQTNNELPFPGQYGDYCITQKQWLASQVADEQLAYWTNNLDKAPLKINLPMRTTRTIDKNAGTTLRMHLDRKKWEVVEQLAEQRGETPFSILLSVYFLMLQRFSSDNDICVGSAFANRQWINADSIIGMMINTVVLRSKINPEMALSEFLSQVSDTVFDAQAHQDLPFEYLVKKLNPEREPGVNPLFQVFFGFHDSPMPEMELPQIDSIRVLEAIDSRAAKFDLSVVVIPRNEQEGKDDPVHMLWEFKTAKLPQWLIENMINVYMQVLDSVLANVQESVKQITHSSTDIVGVNKEVNSQTVYQRFRQQALNQPDRPAITCDGKTVSYRQLLSLVEGKSAYLANTGIEQGSFVGLCLPRGVNIVAWMLACQATGIGYVPLDPDYPVERIKYIISHSEIGFVVGEDDTYKAQQLNPDAISDAKLPQRNVDTASPMYCMYTSGSTGMPKGVVISHKAFANFIDAMSHEFALQSEHRWLAVTSFSFDISTLEVFLPLVSGAEVLLINQGEDQDVKQLCAYLESSDVTHCQATPGVWRTLTELGWKPSKQQVILCGGEALDASLARALSSQGNTCFNMYGPTETTVWSSIKRIQPDLEEVTLGKPISNTQFFLLDDDLKSVPTGATGNLWIAGESLADGYLHSPELTEERFIMHPELRCRMYHTGDLAAVDNNGELHFLGRSDHQIKLSGYRIELGEIEEIIRNVSGVVHCAVVVRTIGEAEQLVAFVQTELDEQQIIARCQNYLPAYMLPKQYIKLDAIPLTPNKKVDRKALPENLEIESVVSTPKNDTEILLAKLYVQVLGLEQVDTQKHFYKLGGNSLIAMRLSIQIEEQFKLSFKATDIIQLGTIHAIAAYIDMMTDSDEYQEFDVEFVL